MLPTSEGALLLLFRTDASLRIDDRAGKEKQRRCSSGFFPPSSCEADFFLFQTGSQLLNDACQDGQGHIALKAVDPMIGTPIQAMYLQGINRRLDRRMLASCRREHRSIVGVGGVGVEQSEKQEW